MVGMIDDVENGSRLDEGRSRSWSTVVHLQKRVEGTMSDRAALDQDANEEWCSSVEGRC